MNNFNRNTRTLIVSFLIAIFALIPLRFIEAGEEMALRSSDSQVLGEKVSVSIPTESKNVVKLEAPYDEIEACLSREKFKVMENENMEQLRGGNLDREEMKAILDELERAEEKVCTN